MAASLKALPAWLMIGAASGPAFCTPVEPAPLVASADVDALLANVDLAAVHRQCDALYGTSGTTAVSDAQCQQDAARLAETYRAAGEPVPPGLLETDKRGRVGAVMTPRRLLTWAYQDKERATRGDGMLTSTNPRDLLHRLLSRGADRRVLLALWAWASLSATPMGADACKDALRRAWDRLPDRTPAAPELAPFDDLLEMLR